MSNVHPNKTKIHKMTQNSQCLRRNLAETHCD